MDLVIYWLPIVGGILATVSISSYFVDQKSVAIWNGFATAVALALLFALQLQQKVWESMSIKAPAPAPASGVAFKEPTFLEKPDHIVFSFGAGGMIMNQSLAQVDRPFTPMVFGGFEPFKLYVEGNRLFVDAAIWGGKGEPSIEIKHNQFTVRPSRWDRNSDESALEVVDENLDPVFQLIYEAPLRVTVNAIMPTPSGLMLAGPSGFIQSARPEQLKTFVIPRIFKYPSGQFPGTRLSRSN